MPPTNTPAYKYNYNLSRLSPGIYRDLQGGLVTGHSLNRANRDFNKWATDFSTAKVGDANYDTLAGNIKKYGRQYGYGWGKIIGKNWKPGQTAPPVVTPDVPLPPAPDVPPPATDAPSPVGSGYENYQSPMTKSLIDAMRAGMSTTQAYEPRNFEGSPLYQFQKQKGSQDLEKLMSSRGLTGSGAEVQANSDFLVNLNAQESEKQRQYADQAAQRNQSAMQFIANYDQNDRNSVREQMGNDLTRRIAASQFESTRGDRRQEMSANFLQNILQMQSQNDIARLSQNGLDKQSGYSEALMNAIAQFTGNNYKRSYGGGGGTPPRAPSGGDFDIMKILSQYGNGAGDNDSMDGIFRLLFGGKDK